MIKGIDQANDAKRNLMSFNATEIEYATIVLGNTGFRIEVKVKSGSKWIPPAQVMGVPVVSK